MKRVSISILTLFFTPVLLFSNYSPDLDLDYACFISEHEDQTLVQVYCEILNRDIQFYKSETGYQADVTFDVILYNHDGDYVRDLLSKQTFVCENYERTVNLFERQYGQFDLMVSPGQYIMKVHVTDQGSKNQWSKQKHIHVPAFSRKQLAISSIQVVDHIEKVDEKTAFSKNGYAILSNISHRFGADASKTNFYFEVYNLEFNERSSLPLGVKYLLCSENGDTITQNIQTYPKNHQDCGLTFSIPKEKLYTGRYRLIVEATDYNKKESASSETWFSIYQSPHNLDFSNYDEAIALVKIIATRKEMKSIRNANARYWRDTIEKFWMAKDPTPETARNELKEEFYNRVHHANMHFSPSVNRGWRTDQGKTYIKYGQPNNIYNIGSDFAVSRRRIQIWVYFEQNLSFFFEDRNGLGEYRLVNVKEAKSFGLPL